MEIFKYLRRNVDKMKQSISCL